MNQHLGDTIKRRLSHGFVAEGIYLLTGEEGGRSLDPALRHFLSGLLLCNTRHHNYSQYRPFLKQYLEAADGDSVIQLRERPTLAAPEMLIHAHNHFVIAKRLSAEIEVSSGSNELQEETFGLLIAFLMIEQLDPHTRSQRIAGTEFRVLQAAYLCLAHLSQFKDRIPRQRLLDVDLHLSHATREIQRAVGSC